MNKEELRQRAIEKAWIDEVGEKIFSEYKIDGTIDEDGLLSNRNARFDFYNGRFEYKGYAHRPATLSRLDDNNGWTRIETASDLPDVNDKESLFEVGKMWEDKFLRERKRSSAINVKYMWDHKFITHFRIVPPSIDPLY